MKSFLLFALALCSFGYVTAQQFRLTGAAPTGQLDNIYDLRNTALTNAPVCGLVRFFDLNNPANLGTALHHYNLNTGAVAPAFNYLTNGQFRNLRGAKFTEFGGFYYVVGLVDENGIAATPPRLFLMKISTTTGVVAVARYIPVTWTSPEVSNIIIAQQSIVVSGHAVINGAQQIFALRTDINLAAVNWFSSFQQANAKLVTFPQNLVADGSQLIVGGVNTTAARGVVFKVNPANGALVGPGTNFSICTAPGNCLRINRISIGLMGNFRNMVLQSIADANGVRYSVSRMNLAWAIPTAQNTYNTQRWEQKSVRFEPTGVLIGSFDVPNLAYNHTRYALFNGGLILGANQRFAPPTLDITANIVPQMEIITTNATNDLFAVGKYRHVPSNNLRYLAELQPSKCEREDDPKAYPERIGCSPTDLGRTALQFPYLGLQVTRVELPFQPVQICDAITPACNGGAGIGERGGPTEEEPMPSVEQGDLKIIPNPATDMLRLEMSNGTIQSVQLLDLTGRLVLEHQEAAGTDNLQLSLPQVQSGIYLLRVTDAQGQIQVRKVVIEQ